MSIVTTVLGKLAFIDAIKPKIASLESKLTRSHALAPSVSFARAREWSSPTRAEEFRREELARRAFDEMQARLPIAR